MPAATTLSSLEARGTIAPQTGKLLDIKLSAEWSHAYAGEPLPVTFELSRPTSEQGAVRLHNVKCDDADVHLDIDLLQPGVEIRPGEVYRFVVAVRVLRPKTVDLSLLSLVLSHKPEGGAERVISQVPSVQKLIVQPAIGNEITIHAEPLCKYDEGTKLLLTLTHQGDSCFRDLTVNIGPPSALRAGKPTVQRTSFQPGDWEQVELVVASTDLDLQLSASIKDVRSEARRALSVGSPVVQTRKRFRFLEPRRLARDQQRLYEVFSEGQRRAVPEHHGVYMLESGRQYMVEIRPMQPGAVTVQLNEIAGLVQVRKSEVDKDGAWVFIIGIAGLSVLRKPEQLFYEVETAEGKLSAEIPICVKPSAGHYWQVAGTLGAAITIQGAVVAGRFLNQVHYSLLEAFRQFSLADHFSILLLLSIPAAWLGMRVLDWLYYQFIR